MMNNDMEMKLSVALRAVQVASQLVKRIQDEVVLRAIDKEDRSPVTIADFASQAVISHILKTNLGDICLVGEENSETLRRDMEGLALTQITQYVNTVFPVTDTTTICDWIDFGNAEPEQSYWTVDPIDGTKGFLRGDQYAVALAYVENGQVEIGVLGCPNLTNGIEVDLNSQGSLVYAIKGRGCYCLPLKVEVDLPQKRKLQVSANDTFSEISLLRSFESSHTNAELINQLALNLGITNEPIRMDSQAKYALLAGGKGDVILRLLSPLRPDYQEKIWDQAAGSIIVEEAGGKITDLAGNPLDFSQGRTLKKNKGVLATNGHIHLEIINELHAISS
jgi:3'(2'), 5'-bisphosphate nucleotidase